MNTPTTVPSKFKTWDGNYLHQQFGFYLGLALYSLYIFLIATKTPKNMQPYKKVLFFHCILDLLFIFQNLLLHGEYPCVLTIDQDYKCFVIITAIFVYPSRYIVWFGSLWNQAMNCWHVPGIAVIFLYRYFLICRNFQCNIYLFSICALIALVIPLSIYIGTQGYFTWPKDEDLQYSRYFQSSEWLYEGRAPNFIINPTNLPLISRIAYTIPSYLGYLIIFFTTYKINKALNSIKNRTPKMRKIQREMTIVLWIQAILPFLSHIIPFTSTIVTAVFNWEYGYVFYFTKTGIWAPSLNVILSIMIIEPYRNWLLSIYRRAHQKVFKTNFTPNIIVPTITH